MNAIHFIKDYSQANAISTGTSALVFGPIPVDHLNNFAVFIANSASVTINFRFRTSTDKARNIEDDFPNGSFTNTQAVAVNSGQRVVRTLYGDANPFRYITILGSATAAVTSSQVSLTITGRANK